MTDVTSQQPARKSTLAQVGERTRKRNAAEKRFQAYGIAAIAISLSMLVFLLYAILSNGLPAFSKVSSQIEVTLTQEEFEEAEKAFLKTKVYQTFVNRQIAAKLGETGRTEEDLADSLPRILGKFGGDIRSHYRENQGDIGKPVVFRLAASSRVDGYFKGRVTREGQADSTFLTPDDLDLVDDMRKAGLLKAGFNWQFITGSDVAPNNPSGAGIGVSMVGSFFMMLVVLGLSLPIGIAASVYLEEFAPKNNLTDLIEVNISNLAAVPSIVFGILGLSVFIQFTHLPQSAPLVGGLVLTLMTLPTIIISTRASLKAVPPSIRDAALGVGASKMQSVFHHVLPLAMPGILTGTIIGLAQALGETAPLLLIGMVGFIARAYPEGISEGFLAANSAMPAQIYTWTNQADPGFYEKAWGGIIVLLLFLMTMNLIAILLRRRFERRW